MAVIHEDFENSSGVGLRDMRRTRPYLPLPRVRPFSSRTRWMRSKVSVIVMFSLYEIDSESVLEFLFDIGHRTQDLR